MTKIELFSDFMCPFCYIGFSIADKLVSENQDVIIDWKAAPLDLNRDLQGEENSIPKEKREKAYERITMLGKEYNLIYNNRTLAFNTNRLHKASKYANEQGKFYEFAKESFMSVFEKGENVGDETIVNKIAKNVGLNIDEMNRVIDSGKYDAEFKEDIALAKEYDIQSVPSFVLSKDKIVTDLKPYEEFKKDLLD